MSYILCSPANVFVLRGPIASYFYGVQCRHCVGHHLSISLEEIKIVSFLQRRLALRFQPMDTHLLDNLSARRRANAEFTSDGQTNDNLEVPRPGMCVRPRHVQRANNDKISAERLELKLYCESFNSQPNNSKW
jgi:hypothetical protein